MSRPATVPPDDRAGAHGADGRGCGASRPTALREPLSGAILAGGAAFRFRGDPKGLELVGTRRILDRVADAMRPVVDELLIVSNAANAGGWLSGARVIRDRYAVRAAMVGVHAALSSSRGDVLVAGWDMPFLSPELFDWMSRQRGPDTYAVVPEGPGGLEPTAAIYAKTALPAIERLVEAGELSMGALLASLPRITRVPLDRVASFGDPRRIFTNVNTRDELSDARTAEPRTG